jgi:ribonucleoside-triphosphate reductase
MIPLIDCTQAVEEYIYNKDWRVNANSNMGYSHAGLVNNLAGKVIANYWLDKVYSKEAGYAHKNVIFIYMTLIIFLDIVLVGV